jgi:DnaJ-class molecular chaperone
MTNKNSNYYEILEITNNANPDEIQKAYMNAKNAYSQDSLALYSLMSKEECDEMLNVLEEAYLILSDPIKRKSYDDARGLNTEMSDRERRGVTNAEASKEVTSPFDEGPERKPQDSVAKTVAVKKYSLEFEQNNEMEQEIEQTTEFSGEFLKKVREYKQVDIKRLAEMTKVSKTYLLNIENEEYHKLPARVYTRGFVYQYAKCLKLNPEMVAASYLARME